MFSPPFKSFLTMALVLFALVAMMYCGPAESQGGTWVRCKHIVTGDTQTFKGSSCPRDWHPV